MLTNVDLINLKEDFMTKEDLKNLKIVLIHLINGVANELTTKINSLEFRIVNIKYDIIHEMNVHKDIIIGHEVIKDRARLIKKQKSKRS